MAHVIQCIKLGKEAEGLDTLPVPGELGERIYNQISKEAWDQWMHRQTILINEFKLSVVDPQARAFLEKEMKAFFFNAENETSADR